MTNKRKIQALKNIRDEESIAAIGGTLEDIGDFVGDYDRVLGLDAESNSWKVSDGNFFDIAVKKRIGSDNYDVLAALLTFLTREDKGDPGAFRRRAKRGEIREIIDRMIAILEGGPQSAARRNMITRENA